MNKKRRTPDKAAMSLGEFLNFFDFSYEKDKVENETVYKLIDNQGANFGGIEQEEFHSISGIVDRLDIYYHDYIYDEISNETLTQRDEIYDGEENYSDILKWLNERKSSHPSYEYLARYCACIVDPKVLYEEE